MRKLISIYAVLILISLVYLFVVEDITGERFVFNAGGRDAKFSFYDLSIIGVMVFSAILTAVSTISWGSRKTQKLFLISVAFFIFTLRSFLNIIFNHFIGGYYFIGVLIQGMEFLVLLIFSSVLLFRNESLNESKSIRRKK